MKKGIGVKLVATFVLVITISMTLSGLSSYLKCNSILKENSTMSSQRLLYESKESIANYMKIYEGSALQMSYNLDLQQILEGDGHLPQVKTLFNSYMKSHKDVVSIYIGTRDKRTYMYPDNEFKVSDTSTRPWYKEAVTSNKLTWTSPYGDLNSKKTVVTVAIPIFNSLKGNEFVGVMGVDINLDTLIQKTNSIKIGVNGYPVILDSNKKVLGHKDKGLVGKVIPIKEIVQAIDNGDEFVEYKYDQDKLGKRKYAIISKIDNLNWYVIATIYDNEISNASKSVLISIVMIQLISLGVSIAIVVVFSKRLTKRISVILKDMEKVRQGDFTVKSVVSSEDEVGEIQEYFNVMTEEVGVVIRGVRITGENIAKSSEELSMLAEQSNSSVLEVIKAVDDIAKGTMAQSSKIETGAEAISNLSDKIGELSKDANEINNEVDIVLQNNNAGLKTVEKLQVNTESNMQSIKKIQEAVIKQDSNINNVDEILETITDIANQTNLLSLNASIEAARAGDAGKGFAVVAFEIRKLADGVKKASEEIRDILGNIQEDSNETVNIMKEVNVISSDQYSSVKEVNNSFERISESIEKIAEKINITTSLIDSIYKDKEEIVDLVDNIASVSEETSAATQQVNASIQEQGAIVEEVNKSASNLEEVANNLSNSIQKFKV